MAEVGVSEKKDVGDLKNNNGGPVGARPLTLGTLGLNIIYYRQMNIVNIK